MKRKLKKIQIYNDLYDVYMIFLIGGEVEDLQKYISRKHGRNAKLYSWGKPFNLYAKDANTTNGYQFHVTAPLGKGEIFYSWHHEHTAYMIGHESFHIIGDIMYNRGVTYNSGSEESFAYLFGWVFGKLFKKLGGKLPKRL